MRTPFYAGGQHRLKAFNQIRRVAFFGVFQPRKILARDGAFGETLEHQIIEFAALGQINRRLDAVIGKARAGADANTVFESRHGCLIVE